MPTGGIRTRTSGIMVPAFVAPATAGYTGPGDIVSFVRWYGLRGYSAAYAAPGTNFAGRVTRASDSTTLDVKILSNGNLDEASLATFLTATTGTWTILYDQSGNTTDLTTTLTVFPAVQLNAQGTHTGLKTESATNSHITNFTGSASLTQPYCVSAVAKRTAGVLNRAISSMDAAGSARLLFRDSADSVGLFAGGFTNATATDNVIHAINGLFNGASSTLNVDGTGTGINPSTNNTTAGQDLPVGTDPSGNAGDLLIFEVGWLPGDQSAQFTALYNNMHTYWGF